MKKLIILFTFILSIGTEAQNLVPNPSFEVYDLTGVPDDVIYSNVINDLLPYAEPWFTPLDECSSDLHFTFTGFENADSLVRTGVTSARIGLWNDFYYLYYDTPEWSIYREYIEVELKEILIAQQEYTISFFVRLPFCSPMHNGLGAYLSEDSVLNSTYNFELNYWDNSLTPLNAQVELEDDELMPTNQWYHFEKTYTATGGERFVTIGNFREDEKMGFITDSIDCFGWGPFLWHPGDVGMIDDIAIFPVGTFQDIANTGSDTLLCVGESIVLGSHDYDNYLYSWADSLGNEWTTATIEVSPTETTTYYLSVKDFAFYETFDSITVTVDACNENIADIYASQIKVFPNPATTIVEIESGYDIDSWKLLDAIGREVASSKYLVSGRNLLLDVTPFDAGLYFLEMELNGIQVVKQLVID